MRTVVVGVMIVILALSGAPTVWADSGGTCQELHCYCNGPDQPDTVAPCDTTCDAVCGSSSSSQSSSSGGGGKGMSTAAFMLVAVAALVVIGYFLVKNIQDSKSNAVSRFPELEAQRPPDNGLTFHF